MRLAPARFAAPALFALALAACGPDGPPAETAGTETEAAEAGAAPSPGLDLDLDYRTLDNGLRVVMAPIDGAPTVTVGVYYGVGFRIEPMGRTGFAHLFEHLMFTGSRHVPRGEFDRLILGAGGINNGQTDYDLTRYYEVAPTHALEQLLWLEADRMAFPDITDETLAQQQGVVVNEVNVNVLNQPYGEFIWLDLPQAANVNWHNAHNFYGALDELKAATLADADDFFADHYRPSNAVLVIAGEFDPARAMDWVEQYFGPIPGGDPIAAPDISEPVQTEEKRVARTDPLAPQPALAVAYHMPERRTDAFYAFALLDQILAQGDDSRLYQTLVQEKGYASGLDAGVLTSLFEYDGPMLWAAGLIHDADDTPDAILADMDAVIADLRAAPVSQAELDRARTKMLSDFYDLVNSPTRFGLTNILAAFALFDDDPGLINTLDAQFRAVTPEAVQAAAEEYLRPTNRTVMIVEPGAGPGDAQ